MPLCNATVGPHILLPQVRTQGTGVCTPGKLRTCITAHTPLRTLLKNKQEVQCEGPQARKQEIRDGSEINRRHLTEHTGSTRHHNAVPAPTSPSKLPPHYKMSSRESQGRAGGKYWPHRYMHWIQVGIWLVAGFTAILLADLAPPDRPGLGEWMEEVPQQIHLESLQLTQCESIQLCKG